MILINITYTSNVKAAVVLGNVELSSFGSYLYSGGCFQANLGSFSVDGACAYKYGANAEAGSLVYNSNWGACAANIRSMCPCCNTCNWYRYQCNQIILPPACDSFSASPNSIFLGNSSTLTWTTSNATSVSIDNGVISTALLGNEVVSPIVDTTYTLTATDGTSSSTCSETITVLPPLPACDSFSASPNSIFLGNSSTLTWTTTDAVNISVSPSVGVVTVDNIAGVGVMPNTTTTYTITAFNIDGATTTCTTTVSVILAPPPLAPPPASGGHSKLDYFDKDVVVVLNDAIKVLLSWIGGITLLFLIIGGVLYVSSGANPETQGKAKRIITYAIIGLMLSLLSYAIIAVIDGISV